MPRALIALFMIIICTLPLSAQETDPRLDPVRQKYADFKYDEVITLSNELLDGAAGLSQQDSLELYRLQAIAYFSLLDMAGTLKSFSAILAINPEFRLSVINTPPKVISFFNDLKSLRPEPDIKTVTITRNDTVYRQYNLPGQQIALSMLVPGLGHIQADRSTKGWILLSSATASLAATVYYSIDAAEKEDAYLNEINRERIESRYDSYNDAYQLRNTFLILFGAIWMYTQIDLLLIEPIQIGDQVTLDFSPPHNSILSLTYSF